MLKRKTLMTEVPWRKGDSADEESAAAAAAAGDAASSWFLDPLSLHLIALQPQTQPLMHPDLKIKRLSLTNLLAVLL